MRPLRVERAWQFVLAGVVLGVAAAIVEGAPEMTWTLRFLAALTRLALVATVAAFVTLFRESLGAVLISLWIVLRPGAIRR